MLRRFRCVQIFLKQVSHRPIKCQSRPLQRSGGNGTKIASTGDIFDQPPGQTIRVKLADRVGDHVVLSPKGAVLVTSSGTKSSYPRPPQSMNPSPARGHERGTEVNGSHHGDNPLLKPTGIPTTTTLPGPTNRDYRKLLSA
ncbi:unnamed protein product [Ascophyllum nodosum]